MVRARAAKTHGALSMVPKTALGAEGFHPVAQCRLEARGGGGEAGGASRAGDGLEHGQRSPHLPSPQEPHSLQWREAGVGLTLLLASSRPLLLLSFSTKRGSTGDALETEAQNGVSLRVGHPVCGHAALGPKSKLAGQMAPRGRPEAPEDGQGWWGGAICTRPPAWAQPGVSTVEAAPPHYVPPPSSTGGRWAGGRATPTPAWQECGPQDRGANKSAFRGGCVQGQCLARVHGRRKAWSR